MIADDGITPILMDLGSCIKARIPIENRSQALLHQDIAAEHSTMAYRAPELFDVKTGTTLDEKVDVWVKISPSLYFSRSRNLRRAVFGLRSVRPCIPPLPFRDHANNGTRWLNSHGCAQRTVQAPYVKLFTRTQDPY
jgi:hypothetical protein